MKPLPALLLGCVLGVVVPVRAEPVATPPVVHEAVGTGGAVASPHPLATQAGLEVLKSGGNALDAIVAIGLTLGVVDSHNSGIGGGCFLLAHLPDGRLLALDGREMAPASAHRDMFLKPDGSADSEASRTGPAASGVPGSLAVYDHVLQRHGTTRLARHLEAAATLAERGFRIDARYAARLRAMEDGLRRFARPAASPVFLADGQLLPTGAVLRQADLAATYRAIARDGIAHFYRGPFAKKTAAWMAEHEGTLTRDDFANYKIRERTPIRTRYREHEIVGFPPPSSGGTHVAQMLNILQSFAMEDLEPVTRAHLVVESMKLAFADRAHWLGDSDFAAVPVAGLVADDYARRLAARIDPERASVVAGPGTPPGATDPALDQHTAHFTAVDEQGYWVACTATLNTSFGSKVVIPGTGVFLNNQMDDFSSKPGVPNAFGLVGAEANAIAPGKRPLSSMSPTLVLRHGRPILTVGGAGGPTIITQALFAIHRTVDLGSPLRAALAGPRFHHQWRPDELLVEPTLDPALRAGLQARGHRLRNRTTLGTSQGISRRDGLLTAVSEPRALGAAAVVSPK